MPRFCRDPSGSATAGEAWAWIPFMHRIRQLRAKLGLRWRFFVPIGEHTSCQEGLPAGPCLASQKTRLGACR